MPAWKHAPAARLATALVAGLILLASCARGEQTDEVEPEPAPTFEPLVAFGEEITVLPGDEKVVALTFDAGGNADGVDSVLQTLAEECIYGTFFLTGHWTRFFPEEAQRISRSHPIGNHTDTHPSLTEMSLDEARQQITLAEETIRQITGLDPRPHFRFPYGDLEAGLMAMASELGYATWGWTTDALGWMGAEEGWSVERARQRVAERLVPGMIILMHVGSAGDGTTLDADALPHLISDLREQGYKFVTLDEYGGRGPPPEGCPSA